MLWPCGNKRKRHRSSGLAELDSPTEAIHPGDPITHYYAAAH